jgi:hypothetical protein
MGTAFFAGVAVVAVVAVIVEQLINSSQENLKR